MSYQALVEAVRLYNPQSDGDLIRRAFETAASAHRGQTRSSGEPYITHPLAVAEILAQMHLGDATIAAALLHDVVEDTGLGLDVIEERFGGEIAVLVDGLTKIKRLRLATKRAAQAENFRKLLLAITTDLRVLLIKLADRLHNMRTINHVPVHKRTRISTETVEIYAPLAGRMGMQWLREELEHLSFPAVDPSAHEMISTRLAEIFESNSDLLDEVQLELEELFQRQGIAASVTGRAKQPYSIYRKMQRRQVSFDQLSDIYGFRAIVADVDTCYRALGHVHTTWPAVPERFKDYISTPKSNGYRSLHTTVVGPGKQRVELQLRTKEMQELAEYGVAAHTLYKEPGDPGSRARGRVDGNEYTGWHAYDWLRRHVQSLLEGDNPEELLEHTRLELFQDQVFCFSPKGRLIALPLGATPIDFAYAVHSDIGDNCVGARINGNPAPLNQPLRTGDEVRIVTTPDFATPLAYENLAVTGRARSAIRRAARARMRDQYVGLGVALLEATFERRKKVFSRKLLKPALSRLSQTSADEVLTAVGRNELAASDVFKAVYPEEQAPEPTQPQRQNPNSHVPPAEKGWFSLPSVSWLKFKVSGSGPNPRDGARALTDRGVPIRGVNGAYPVRLAEGVVPGERVVGIIKPGEGLVVYPIDSPELGAFDGIDNDRWIDVTWDLEGQERAQRHGVTLILEVLNEPGSLAEIARVMGDNDGNIDLVQMLRRAHDFTTMQIDLEVWDLKHLTGIIKEVRALPSVHTVERRTGRHGEKTAGADQALDLAHSP
ncbi:MAG: bifunctional (p)ppGpp synthetase/guanosine-3',5'-bis(diphosphate) 3'-pyrophosphohydrolase [Pseudomonadota bacterium]